MVRVGVGEDDERDLRRVAAGGPDIIEDLPLAARYARVDKRDRLAIDEVHIHEAVEGDAGRYRHLEREPERVDGGGDLHGECLPVLYGNI